MHIYLARASFPRKPKLLPIIIAPPCLSTCIATIASGECGIIVMVASSAAFRRYPGNTPAAFRWLAST